MIQTALRRSVARLVSPQGHLCQEAVAHLIGGGLDVWLEEPPEVLQGQLGRLQHQDGDASLRRIINSCAQQQQRRQTSKHTHLALNALLPFSLQPFIDTQ